MNRIENTFNELKNKNETGLIIYVTAGDGGIERTKKIIKTIADSGADIIEIGIPYSDPSADGPVIERASQRALLEGIKTDQIFEMIKELRKEVDIPMLLMFYYNSMYRYGEKKFLDKCKKSQVDGVIVPDLPFEESNEVKLLCKDREIEFVSFTTPVSKDRIDMIAKDAKGFIYCVSSLGVTGERSSFSSELKEYLDRIKKNTDTPRAVGFGISSKDQIKSLKDSCEAVIVGSKIIRIIEKLKDEKLYDELCYQIKEFKEACK